MAFLIKDTNPQYGGQCYFVGTRKIRDPHGRECEAADFGSRECAKKYTSKGEATKRVSMLNQMARRNQFVLEEENIYTQQYGRRRMGATNGFTGFGHLPEPHATPAQQHGGVSWGGDDDGYNGF